MAYTATTIDSITNEVLRLAHEKAAFIGTINRQFDSSFGNASGKIGDTLRIREPARYTRRQNSRVMNVQDSVETNTSLVVATQDGVDRLSGDRCTHGVLGESGLAWRGHQVRRNPGAHV